MLIKEDYYGFAVVWCPGWVEDGKIMDPRKCSRAIASFIAELDLQDWPVICCDIDYTIPADDKHHRIVRWGWVLIIRVLGRTFETGAFSKMWMTACVDEGVPPCAGAEKYYSEQTIMTELLGLSY